MDRHHCLSYIPSDIGRCQHSTNQCRKIVILVYCDKDDDLNLLHVDSQLVLKFCLLFITVDGDRLPRSTGSHTSGGR